MYEKRVVRWAIVVTFCAAIGVVVYFNKDLIQAYNLKTLPAVSGRQVTGSGTDLLKILRSAAWV